ncbi:hypothetical protein G7Y89_g11387 [Cudoniella acicularis]|uniref:RNA helicase n=1 Tax=Cudoniella acicularis TaxID=354080 RepID=A0A8H4VY27_9HELO|nr:hypothetical protein G7Y89_g11387 [Cudoniella acicularis]
MLFGINIRANWVELPKEVQPKQQPLDMRAKWLNINSSAVDAAFEELLSRPSSSSWIVPSFLVFDFTLRFSLLRRLNLIWQLVALAVGDTRQLPNTYHFKTILFVDFKESRSHGQPNGVDCRLVCMLEALCWVSFRPRTASLSNSRSIKFGRTFPQPTNFFLLHNPSTPHVDQYVDQHPHLLPSSGLGTILNPPSTIRSLDHQLVVDVQTILSLSVNMAAAWETNTMASALPTDTNASLGWGASTNVAPAADAGGWDTGADTTAPAAPAAPTKTPQEHGWVAKHNYDYESYNKSNKEIAEAHAVAQAAAQTGDGDENAEGAEAAQGAEGAQANINELGGAVGGIRVGDWSCNAIVYEWKDEYGDVGPKFPLLEQQLFGSEFHVKAGIQFSAVTELNVTQEGNIRINPVRKFEDAGLHPVMLENVKLAGYDVPTPIQQYCLPTIFKGHDLIACAQTGSGKTAAFLIPILSKLMGKAKKLAAPRPNPALFQPGISPNVKAEPLVLIVCPSRELATQIFDEARRFCYRTMLRPCVIYGGGPVAEQITQLQKGCDVLIGTPGRLCDFINRPHILTLRRLRYMVIDEADEMVQSDWEQELKQIMSGGDQEEGNIKYLMFSATFPKVARELAAQHLANDHVRIKVGRIGSTHKNIQQDVVFVEAQSKKQALFDLLMSLPPARTIIFVNSKRAADEVDDFLFNLNMPCTSIHSDRTQREREDSIRAFRLGKAPVLIATGVSARGLDIHNVAHVINFDLPSPQYGGIEEYTHRIGRTGRIGNRGLATSFYNDRDADLAPILVKTLLETGQPVPDFLSEHIPTNWAPGKEAELEFENDSEDGDAEEVGASGDAGDVGAWGAAPATDANVSAPAASGGDTWGTPAPKAAAQGDGWGAPVGNDAWGSNAAAGGATW